MTALLELRVTTLETKVEELLKICHELNKMILDTSDTADEVMKVDSKHSATDDMYEKQRFDMAPTFVEESAYELTTVKRNKSKNKSKKKLYER